MIYIRKQMMQKIAALPQGFELWMPAPAVSGQLDIKEVNFEQNIATKTVPSVSLPVNGENSYLISGSC